MIMVIMIISIIMVVVMEKKILLCKTTFASFLHFSASFINSFARAFTFRDIVIVITINLFNVMITINITQNKIFETSRDLGWQSRGQALCQHLMLTSLEEMLTALLVIGIFDHNHDFPEHDDLRANLKAELSEN